MPSAALNFTQVRRATSDVLSQAMALSDQLERGLAERPLAEHLRVLAGGDDTLVLALLARHPAHADAVLGWWTGHEVDGLLDCLPDRDEVVVVRFHGRGLRAELAGARRTIECEAWPAFAEALRAVESEGGAGTADAGGPCLWLPAPRALWSVRVLLPRSMSAMVRSPRVLAALSSAPLVVVTSDATRLAADDVAAVRDVVAGAEAAWCVHVAGDGGPAVAAAPFARDVAALPPASLTRPAPPLPGFLADAADERRASLVAAGRARRAYQAVALIAERLDGESRQLAARQAALSRQLRAVEESARDRSSRADMEAARRHAAEHVERITTDVTEVSRKSLLPGGELARGTQEILAVLGAEDFAEEVESRTIRLSIHADTLRRVSGALARLTERELDRELDVAEAGVAALRDALADRLSALRGGRTEVRLPPPDRAVFRRAVGETVEISDLRYRGERPKRGFLERLSQGRRPVFVVLSTLSLTGSVFGFTRRAFPIAVAALAMFAAGTAYTFVSFRRQDEELLRKELERARDQLAMELRRKLGEGGRDRVTRINAYLADVLKEASRTIESAVTEAFEARAQVVERDRSDLRERLRSLEVRSRELQAAMTRLGRVQQAAGDLDAARRKLASEAIRGMA